MPHDKRMDNCERILKLVRKNRNGISVQKIAKKLDVSDDTVYRATNNNQDKIRLDRGIAFPIENDNIVAEKKPGKLGLFINYLKYRNEEKNKRARMEYESSFSNLRLFYRDKPWVLEVIEDWKKDLDSRVLGNKKEGQITYEG